MRRLVYFNSVPIEISVNSMGTLNLKLVSNHIPPEATTYLTEAIKTVQFKHILIISSPPDWT